MKKHLILAATLTCAALGAQAQERTVRDVMIWPMIPRTKPSEVNDIVVPLSA